VLDTVLDAMTDHEKLSLEVLDNDTKSRAFALVILKMLKVLEAPSGGPQP
jgi:type I restriction enzyme R subunit